MAWFLQNRHMRIKSKKVKEFYTVIWDDSLSSVGSYIGKGNIAESTTTNYGGKRIKYTDINGNTAYANPYKSGSITIKGGTGIVLQMYASECGYGCYNGWYYNGDSQSLTSYSYSGKLISSGEYVPEEDGWLHRVSQESYYYDGSDGNLIGYKYNFYLSYDTYDTVTITWSNSINSVGSYLGTGTLSSKTTTKYGWSRIKYIDGDGNTGYINPYSTSGSVVVKAGTLLTAEMYGITQDSETYCQVWFTYLYTNGSGSGKYVNGNSGELISVDSPSYINKSLKLSGTFTHQASDGSYGLWSVSTRAY